MEIKNIDGKQDSPMFAEIPSAALDAITIKLRLELPGAEELLQALDEEFGPAAQMIAHHEGLRTTLYEDRAADGDFRGHAIGVGRNLTVRGITKQEALILYLNDLRSWVKDIREHVPEYDALDPVRRAVLLDMAHTLSANGLGRFKGMRHAIVEQNWARAVYEMGDSKWYEQQPRDRSCLLLMMMLTGRYGKDFDVADRDQQGVFHATSRGSYQAALGRGGSKPVEVAAVYLPQKPQRKDPEEGVVT